MDRTYLRNDVLAEFVLEKKTEKYACPYCNKKTTYKPSMYGESYTLVCTNLKCEAGGLNVFSFRHGYMEKWIHESRSWKRI